MQGNPRDTDGVFFGGKIHDVVHRKYFLAKSLNVELVRDVPVIYIP